MYTEKELNKLIEDVEKEFTAHLAKAEENFKLAKSEESSAPAPEALLAKAEEEKKEDKKEEKEEPKSEEKPAPEEKEEAKEAAPEQKEEEKAPEAHQEEEHAEGHDSEEHGYDDEDMDHMHAMYSSMSKGELKAHHDAVRKALDGKGMEKCGEMAPQAPAMQKSEPSVEVELLKSEVSAKSAKVEELQKSLDTVTEILTKLVAKKSAPAAKAITSLEVVAKSEASKEEKVLTKSEITQVLAKKAADPSLSAQDRQAINAYYLNGASINSISHLLSGSGK